MNTQFHTSADDFIVDTCDSDFRVTGTIVTTQNIPQSFLDKVRAKRDFQDAQTFGQLTKGDDLERIHLCRIPVSVVSKWSREGFDMMALLDSGDPKAAQTILAKLRLEEMEGFQTTSKNF
jgi:hypothetical protein